jgi:hypothetical protein
MIRNCFGTLVLVLAATSTAYATEPAPAGRIKITTGSAMVVRAHREIPASVGQTVFESDILKTGDNGHVGVTLADDTRISIGPGSEVHLDQFVYSPATGQVGLVLQMVRGIMAYVSGRIAKLSPDAVKLETPSAIVGVRGTTLALRITGQ